jgi:DNA-binding response OmpR family regulator
MPMTRATLLLIGRGINKGDSYTEVLKKRYTLVEVTSGKQALAALKSAAATTPFQAVILDAASLRTPGDRICKQIRYDYPKLPILHVHPGPHEEVDSPADVLFFIPINTRKLTAAVERLLDTKHDEVIACGPFVMNVPRRTLVAHGQETQLTPKVALLIELFLRHPNQTFDRKKLMETIWQTDYLGDTRTLNVHIRWVRDVLEKSDGSTRYLTTVRGIGYRLDVPTTQPVPVPVAVTTKR